MANQLKETASMKHQNYKEQWNDSLSGDYLWNNTNFGEAITETMTPLTWSVLYFTLDDWVFLPGYSTVGNIGGLPYINISIFASVFQALGRNRKQLDETLEGTMYMQLPEGMDIPTISMSRKETFQGLLNLLRTQSKQVQGMKHISTYLATNPDWFKEMHLRIKAEGSGKALASLWNNEIKGHIKDGVWTVLGTANYSANFTGKLRRELTLIVGPEDANLLISNLSAEDELLASLGPSVGLAKVANGKVTQKEYIEKFGHRGPHEFELSKPRPVEDPDWLNRQLATYQKTPLNVQDLFQKQQVAFDSAWRRFSSKHPRKANGMLRRLKDSAHRAHLREQARSEYVRDRWLIRIFAQHASKLTDLGDNIFFLTLDEMLELLSGKTLPTDLIPVRKEIYLQYKALPSYPSVIRGHFDPFKWANNPKRRNDIYDQHASLSAQTSDIIKGAPGSAGTVEGLARVMAGSEENDQFQPGEILVTRMTDISWTPIFPHAAAIVTDIGAPLSHAAIVARELGIPAVVGCQDVTMRLKTGDRIRVNGSAGTVKIIQKA
jgi:phosphohistidine swiveling domain-containing protein